MRNKRTAIGAEDLQRYLQVEGLSYRDVGAKYGIHRSVVSRRAKELGLAEGHWESDTVQYPDDNVWIGALAGRRFEDEVVALTDIGSTGKLSRAMRAEHVSGCGNGSEMCAVMGGAEHEAESTRVATWADRPRDDVLGAASRRRSASNRFRGVDGGHTAGIDRHVRAAA